jgi:hypothetical protein
MYGRVHLCNMPQLLLPGVQLQINFTKAKSDFYIHGTKEDNTAYFKCLDATLHVRHVKPSPIVQLGYTKVLETVKARYDITRVAIKTYFCSRI